MSFLFYDKWPIPNTGLGPVDYTLRSFFHANLIHLAANLFTLWQLSDLAKSFTTQQFINLIIMLTILSSSILYLINYLIPSTKTITIGFSGVIFGLFVVSQKLSGYDLTHIGTKNIIQILPQLLIPGISFWGHLSGIISGFIYIFFNNMHLH
jgi:rhomboid domain-containing protein 1